MIGRARSWVHTYLGGEDPRPAAAMFGLNAIDEFDNAAYTWLAPVILATWHKGVGTAGGILIAASFIAPFLGLPVSRMADRRSRMPIVLIGAAVWGTFSLLTGLSVTLGVLFLARVVSTFGRTATYPIQAGLMSDFYSPRSRVNAMGIFSAASSAGDAIGPLMALILATSFGLGWRPIFIVIGILAIPTIMGCSRVKEPTRGRFEAIQTTTVVPFREVLRLMSSVRTLRFQMMALTWLVGSVYSSRVIIAFFFKDSFGFGDRGLLAMAAVAGAGAFVTTIWGAPRAQARVNVRPSDGLRWMVSLGLVLSALLAALALSPGVWVAVPVLFLIFAGAGLVSPLFLSMLSLVAPPELRSQILALSQVIPAVGGLLIVGVTTGIASQWGNRAGLVVVALLFVRGALHLRTAAKFIDDDVERLSPEHVNPEGRLDAKGRRILLETKDLTVSYDTVRVLFGVDICVAEGEIVALLGTNGAGKSTVLNAVCGLTEPDGGNVWFDGEAITGESAERVARRGLLQAPGGRGIFPGLSVADNLKLGAFLIRGDKGLSSRRINEALDAFPALRPLVSRRAGDLSGGERQMLVLAQAFLLRPKMLLIDELSLGLAPVIVQDLLVAVRRLNAEGIAIVLVEQSVNVALMLAERAYFLEKGEVRFEGATADLLKRGDLLRSVFLEGAGAADA